MRRCQPGRALPGAWLLAPLLAALAGCFDAEVELHVLADGRGVVRVSIELPREALSAGDDAALAAAAVEHLGRWSGVDAWSERDLLDLPREGRVRLVATGWCRDLSALRAPLPVGLRLARAAGKLELRVVPGELAGGRAALDAAAWGEERKRLLDPRLGEARARLRLFLPGEPEPARGATITGRSATRAWEGTTLQGELQALVGELELLRGRVAQGGTAPAEAVEREAELLQARLGLGLTCPLPADDGGAGALFERGLQAALEAWQRARTAPAAGGAAAPDRMEQARREQAEAEADAARAMAEAERWREELDALQAEDEEEGQRELAGADPTRARLRVELLDAPQDATAQVIALPQGEGTPQGAPLERGRWDGEGLTPGAWRLTVLVTAPGGGEWSFLREARLAGGGFGRVTVLWPRSGGTLAGTVAAGPGRVARAWTGDLRVSAPVGADGAFRLGPLPPGSWKVAITEGDGPWIEDPGQLPAALEVRVAGEEAHTVAPPGVAWDGQASRVLWR